MEQERMMLLQKHDHIWQRVRPDVDPYSVPVKAAPADIVQKEKVGEEWVLGKIAAEEKDRDYYLILARRGGMGSREFFHLAAEEEHHARRLRAMWFLGGGEWIKSCPAAPPCVPQKKAEALRERYAEECRGAEEYFAMAEASRGCAAEVLRAMGREEQRHAEKILQILERLL